MNAHICADMFQKIIKTKPRQEFNPQNDHVYLIYELLNYQLFVEIGEDFRVDYQVRMSVTHNPNKVGG